MIFKQIHTLPIGPNWVKIALITVGVIMAGCIAYNAAKLLRVKIEPKPQLGNENK